MRTMLRNKQKMYYSNFQESEPIYEKDSDGKIVYETYVDNGVEYKYPKEIGNSTAQYEEPNEMYAVISMAGGEAEAKEFGLDISQYSAVLLCAKGEYSINETCLIWYKNEIKYKDDDETIIDQTSADYRVVKVSESLNYNRYVLQRVINNG